MFTRTRGSPRALLADGAVLMWKCSTDPSAMALVENATDVCKNISAKLFDSAFRRSFSPFAPFLRTPLSTTVDSSRSN